MPETTFSRLTLNIKIFDGRKIALSEITGTFKIADRAKHVFVLLPEVFRDLTAGYDQSDPAQFIVAGAFARGLPKIGDTTDHRNTDFPNKFNRCNFASFKINDLQVSAARSLTR